jgi:ATP-dependent DNA helicase PIF1
VPRVFPNYSPNPRGKNYSLYCEYQLLKYKSWKNPINDAWGSENPDDNTYISAWKYFLNLPYAKQRVPNWEEKLHAALDCVVQPVDDPVPNEDSYQEDWMIIANLHNSKINDGCQTVDQTLHDWSLDRQNYSEVQMSEMPQWSETKKKDNAPLTNHYVSVDITCFSERQNLAYQIILNHASKKGKEPLLLIVTGEAGTGKSYLINAVQNYLKDKCAVTATTGKAAYNINGITIHSLLKLPVPASSHKDLSWQSLVILQEK